MEEKINLDEHLDYRKLFTAIIEKPTVSGDSLTGCCPIHKDSNPSFSVNLKTGQCKCFSCGWSGNYVSLYAQLHGLTNKEAFKEILHTAGLDSAPAAKQAAKPRQIYTVQEYCLEKRFNPEWLHSVTGMEKCGCDRNGDAWLRIPYYDEQHRETLFRKRYRKDAACRFKWGAGSAGKLMLYGEWTLPEVRSDGYAILVEGESDTQTLWLLGLRALGVPGASTYKPDWTERLQGLKLYLHIEPDRGGQVFLEQMTRKLRDGGFEGEVYQWSCKQFGVKDPSDLYIQCGKDEAAEKVKSALHDAKRIDLADLAASIPVAIKDAPLHLRQPAGFIYDEQGIHLIDEKTSQPVMVCRTPILITKRLKSQESGEEKIEIAFKRDGRWRTAVFPRTTVFAARNIIELARLGATVTSENAKNVVSYLAALESENIDVIETVKSAESFGWQTNGGFLPWHADGVVLDAHPSMERWAGAYQKNGSLEDWIALMAPHRSRYRFRFILAAGFAAPLLRIIRQRIFFVYNWGGSRGGKTAALKAALSAWGDPERLMANFNATQVALERMAGFYCDLPMGIDERQLAGNRQEGLEKMVYMIANGTGRSRGAKDGGLQALKTWRTVALATGEEPIGRENSMTGVSTRVIEVIGAPFDSEAAASEMHQHAGDNTGWAGDAFLDYIISLGDEVIAGYFNELFDEVKPLIGTANGSHAAGIAAVVTADYLLSRLFFAERDSEARAHALQMAQAVMGDMQANQPPDVNENAVSFIRDWVTSGSTRNFGKDCTGTCYGFLEDEVAYIIPTSLREALEHAGFSYRKTMKHLADTGGIVVGADKKTSVQRWFNGRNGRFIAFRMTEEPQQDFTEISDGEPSPFDENPNT